MLFILECCSFAFFEDVLSCLKMQSFAAYGDDSAKGESKSGFWGVLARKAKAILDDDNMSQQYDMPERMRSQPFNNSAAGQVIQS